jgi:hypothetical protein
VHCCRTRHGHALTSKLQREIQTLRAKCTVAEAEALQEHAHGGTAQDSVMRDLDQQSLMLKVLSNRAHIPFTVFSRA